MLHITYKAKSNTQIYYPLVLHQDNQYTACKDIKRKLTLKSLFVTTLETDVYNLFFRDSLKATA